jgi:hypothetical protein
MGQSFFYLGKKPAVFAKVFSDIGRMESHNKGNEQTEDTTARAIAA